MEQLVNEKVDVFWKGIESGTNKRGQVMCRMFSIHGYPSLPLMYVHDCTDPGHLFGKETQEIMVPGVCRRRRRSMGTMASRFLYSSLDLDASLPNRIVNAELRQPKSDRGTPPRIRPISFVLTPRFIRVFITQRTTLSPP